MATRKNNIGNANSRTTNNRAISGNTNSKTTNSTANNNNKAKILVTTIITTLTALALYILQPQNLYACTTCQATTNHQPTKLATPPQINHKAIPHSTSYKAMNHKPTNHKTTNHKVHQLQTTHYKSPNYKTAHHLLSKTSKPTNHQITKRLNLNIAQEGVNKISVERDRITKVIGNEQEYNIEGDSASGTIFLSTKLTAGDKSSITIITEKGFTQDITLNITKAREPATIVIKKPIPKETKKTPREEAQKTKQLEETTPQTIKQLVAEAIKDISTGSTRNYTFRRINIKTLTEAREPNPHKGYNALTNSNFKVTKIAEYSNRYINILKYEYETKPTSLTSNKITALFPQSLAVSERGNAILVVYKQ